MQISKSRISIIYIIAIIFLLALISLSSIMASRNMQMQSNTIVNEAIPILSTTNSLLTDLLNQETGIRGLEVTSDENYLDSFNAGKEQLNKDLETLRKFEKKYPQIITMLESEAYPQIVALQNHYNNQIELIRAGKLDEARHRIVIGKSLMDQYRVAHNKMLSNVQQITNEANAASNKAGTISRAITIIGGFIALVIAVISGMIFYRAHRFDTELRKSEETYRYMAESLEVQNEEIIAQQEEQTDTLAKLSEREHELELITSYQEKLTGFLMLDDFLKRTVPALLDSLNQDAALVVMERPGTVGNQYEVIYSSGYPMEFVSRMETELFGPAKRLFEEEKSFYRKRELTEKERGLHQGHTTAVDQYFPLLNDEQKVIGFLLLTNYQTFFNEEENSRLTRGLIRQFGLAFYTHVTNEDKRQQALDMEKLNNQLMAEKQLIEDQRDLIERILEAAHEGMVMCDSQGTILFANQRMRGYFNLHLHLTRNLIDSCREISKQNPNFNSVSSSIEALLEGGLPHLTQRFSFEDDNQIHHAELYATIVGEETDEKGYLFVFRDRTEEERVDEMKNEFISIVSHELRTPLASVLGFIEILLHRDLSQEKQKKYMETIYKEALRLSNLINDFLDLQRMESGRQVYHFSPVNLVATVQEVVEQWQDKQSHHIILHPKRRELWVRGDADRIRQVIHNLISNAVKYSPGSDNVDIYIENVGDKIRLSVQDYGLGIPEDAREEMFSKFFRVDNSDRRQIGGTGLGLAIVKEIVEGHQGHISFTSEMGEGTTFTVELNRYELSSMDGKIVVLEDDDNLAKLIQVALDKLSLPSLQIRSAEEGILSLGRIEGEGPILFIVDIHLEGSKSGWDFIAELYKHPVHYRTPVIVSTALDPPNDYQEKEIEKYLKKPFTMERLIEVAKHLLDTKTNSAYVFPTQNKELLASNLKQNGIEVSLFKESQDILQVELKKRPSGED